MPSIVGKEKGKNGTIHFQGYLELEKRLRFNQVKREQYELGGEVENVKTIANLISLNCEKAVLKQTCI